MKIPNELTDYKTTSFVLSWAITWRFFILFFLTGTIFLVIPTDLGYEYLYTISIIQTLITFILLWFWVHRLLRKGLGRVKVIFMEKEHYDELRKDVNK